MANFAVLGFVDTFALAGSLRSRMGLFPAGTPRIVPIRGPRKGTELADEDFAFYAGAIEKWPELKNMVRLLNRPADRLVGKVALGCISLEQLDPGAVIPWAAESGPYAERWTRAHLALRTNPGAWCYCGAEAAHMEIGFINAVNMQALSSAVNFGEFPRVHLIIDFRKKDAAE